MNTSRPLSIAIVTGSISRLAGGLFNSVRRSALALTEAGHSVTVLSLDDEYASADITAWDPLIPLTVARRGPAALGYGPTLQTALNSGAFDVVHQHGIWQAMSWQVSTWQQQTGGAVMISPRGMLDPWAVKNASWKKRITGALYERKNLASARCLHALNLSEAKSMRAFGLTNPIAVIPNGTDLPIELDVAPPDWWPGGKTLLFIGRIHPKKGVAELIEAYAHYSHTAPKEAACWRLVIAGWDDGGYEAALRATVARYGLADRVIFPGAIYDKEKDAALRHATAFVLPSFSEGMPMSVLEAWAYNLPVLMTDACNLPEGFAAGAAARVTQDPTELAGQLTSLLAPESANALGQMGLQGRALVEENFGWKEIARRHAEVYAWVATGRGGLPSSVVLD